MTDSTPKSTLSSKTKETLSKVSTLKPMLHAGADALFFVQLFARACNTEAIFS